MAERPSRKLAVILHADVVGSTTLVQKDETLAHERMQGAFRGLSKTIESYGGATHELRGDALVAEFGRVSDAVCAAIAFQRENIDVNAMLVDELQPRLRLGIAMGEVVIAHNTVTGEGVVLAQRLEQIAEPDGVCLQGAAYETVPKRLPFEYESRGEQRLKGFAERVRAYRVGLKAGEVVPPPESTQSAPPAWEFSDKPSIAILPFTNMSGHVEQERAHRKPPGDLTAWECYHRGLWHLYRFNLKDFSEARDLFRRALDRDPEFAAAYSGLAYTLIQEVMYGGHEDSVANFGRGARSCA